MQKNKERGYLVLGVCLVLISVIAFVIPFAKTATFWIGYVSALIAIAFQLYIFKTAFLNGEDVKSRFYGFPIARVGVLYLGIQVAFSIVEMSVAHILAYWIAVVINVVFLALAIVGCVAAETMRDEIVKQDVKLKKNVSNMRNLQSMSASLVSQCDGDMKKIIQMVADEFKYSDPVSSDATMAMENNLYSQMVELQNAVTDKDATAVESMAKRLIGDLRERNRVCAVNK